MSEEDNIRQVILDTETTGLEPSQGHRIIEIGCVEMIGRRLTGNNYHQYIQPDRVIDAGAIEVHGITNEFLEDKPRFGQIVQDFIEYISGAELIIHNAPFDVGFINHELKLLETNQLLENYCQVIDTLVMAREKHPGQRNSLDALCQRYDVDNTQRTKHGALLDSEILADVYLAMTGGQWALALEEETTSGEQMSSTIRRLEPNRPSLVIQYADAEEIDAHHQRLETLGENCVWHTKNESTS